MSNFSNRVAALVLSAGLLPLAACATMENGSQTAFMVQTDPVGASVTTDRETEASQHQRARSGAGPEMAQYYGCAPTPCSFDLPRRSDFNVMVTKNGFQPFTWAITKERNNLVADKANTQATVTSVATGSALTASAYAASNAGAIVAAPVGGAMYAGMAALPVMGIGVIVDNMSGALIDLHPNPLKVKMAPELSPEDSQKLIDAFSRSREVHTAEGK